MRNHPRYLEILYAAWWAGLAVMPVNAKLHPREAEWIIDNAQAHWGFLGSVALSEFPKIDPLPVAFQPCEYATHGVSRKRKMLNE